MQVEGERPSLDEDRLAEVAPTIRAELFRRLETLWGALEPYVDGTPDEDGPRRPDPRLMDAAVRVCAQLSRLARLDAPSRRAEETPVAGPELLEAVERSLAELEARTARVAGS